MASYTRCAEAIQDMELHAGEGSRVALSMKADSRPMLANLFGVKLAQGRHSDLYRLSGALVERS